MFIICSSEWNVYHHFPCWFSSGFGIRGPDGIVIFLAVFYKALIVLTIFLLRGWYHQVYLRNTWWDYIGWVSEVTENESVVEQSWENCASHNTQTGAYTEHCACVSGMGRSLKKWVLLQRKLNKINWRKVDSIWSSFIFNSWEPLMVGEKKYFLILFAPK